MFKFEDTSAYGKEAMDSMLSSYATAAKGFQAIAAETADYSKKSFEANVSHMEKLMGVRSMEAAIEMQTSFAKSAVESYMSEMSKLGSMYAEIAKDVYKPMEMAVAKSKQAMTTAADEVSEAA